jgi:hypothetical protein
MEGADRRKQASGTRAPTEPEDVDPTSSQSTAKRGAQHSKNDASKNVRALWHKDMVEIA